MKTAPLVLIGAGLAVCFRANLWNIGAEGQLTAGAIAGAAIPILAPGWESPLVLPLMFVSGILGGAAWAAIPAPAPQPLRGERNPDQPHAGLRRPVPPRLAGARPVARPPTATTSPSRPASRNGSSCRPWATGACTSGRPSRWSPFLVLFVFMSRTLKGFEIRVSGEAPRAGGFGGFSRPRMVWFCFLLAGGLAGLAGMCEVAGTDRPAPALHLAGLRLHRDHRGLPRAAEPDRGAASRGSSSGFSYLGG